MRHYEIINPSDKVIVSAEDETVACVAILLLGEGRYGLTDEDDKRVLPLFLFGGADEWLAERKIDNLALYIAAHGEALAAVFESAFYGSMSELRAIEKSLAGLSADDALARRRAYNDEKRTSMNNIGKACAWWAGKVREIAEEAAHAR